MGMPGVPPESRWPTGDLPRELVSAMVAEGVPVPAPVADPIAVARAEGVAAGAAAVEAEGDELLAGMRRRKGRAAVTVDPRALQAEPVIHDLPPGIRNSLERATGKLFVLPLRDGQAEIRITGKASAADYRLLVKYLTLTAEAMQNGETETAGVPEHDSDGPAEGVSPERRRIRRGERG